MFHYIKNLLRAWAPPALFSLVYRAAWRLKTFVEMNLLGRAGAGLRAAGRGPNSRTSVRQPPGVNLIGPLQAPTGLGESFRALAAALEKTGGNLALIDLDGAGRGPIGRPGGSAGAPYDINVIHVNPARLFRAWRDLGRELWPGRYNIGFWLWELEKFPAAWRPAFGLFDEIWTPSEFVSRAIRQETALPVTTLPYGLAPMADPAHNRGYFGLPEGVFLFLIAADSASMLERKNPLGAVEAFIRAFPKPGAEKVGLIVKVRSAPLYFRRRLKEALAGYPHIYFMDQVMSRLEVNGLLRSADAFVSLHRAEGFGLVLAEAMFLGTPCVATNWSANTEFMPPGAAGLVEAVPVRIGRVAGPYPPDGRWAEPNLDQAADWLRSLVTEPDLGRRLAQAAAEHVREILSPGLAAARLAARLAAIRAAA